MLIALPILSLAIKLTIMLTILSPKAGTANTNKNRITKIIVIKIALILLVRKSLSFTLYRIFELIIIECGPFEAKINPETQKITMFILILLPPII